MELYLDNINKSFGEKAVLKNISIHAKSGRAMGLLGRNGAGKTTTMRIIMNVFKADSGRILVDGTPISKSGLRLGYLPEERGLYPKLPINTQLLYLAELNGLKKKHALPIIKEWLKRLDMEEYIDKKLDTLSKGNQQKIQLISVLMTDPDIIILDEPFSGLDPVNAEALKDIVKILIQQDKIVLFSGHQMSYIEEFCDDIAIIDQGSIALSGNIDEIKDTYPKTHISISGNDTSKIADTIAKNGQPIVERINVDDSELNVYLKNEEDKSILIKLISDNSFDIEGFHVVKPSLEEIFINTTGGAI